MTEPAVIDRPDEQRFVLEADGHEAELTYRVRDGRFHLDHTGVPEEIGGRGLAGRLVEAAVRRAVAEGLVIVPNCPYVERWLERNPDAAASVSVDHEAIERRGD